MGRNFEPKDAFVFRPGDRRFSLFSPMSDDERQIAEHIDRMAPEEEGVIRRYLHYADTLLKGGHRTEPLPFVSLTRQEQEKREEVPEENIDPDGKAA